MCWFERNNRDSDEPAKGAWNLMVRWPKMTWKDMVKKESQDIMLDEEDAQDRKKWGSGIAIYEWKSATPRIRGKIFDYNKLWS